MANAVLSRFFCICIYVKSPTFPQSTSHTMPDALALFSGSSVPDWAEKLEMQEFGSLWGPLGDMEVMWLLDGLAFARWRAVPKTGEAELLRIAVSDGHRREGHAKKLMAESQTRLLGMGCPLLRLEVRVSNAPARMLYESIGWERLNDRKAYYGDGEDAVVYGMEL
jgi:ribosomal protein S18 acetylase RimI-like enzyme